MEYQQLRQPNLDPVVYENGKALLDWYGWCLATVETAFGTARAFATAWAAWNANPDKHQDRNWPHNVYFPIFFSGYGGAGHVAIAYVSDNGAMRIWTSPFEHVPYFYTGYTNVDTLARGYGVTYVGWSTSLSGTQLIAPVPPPPVEAMITIDQLNQLYQQILERAPDPGGIDHYVGHYTVEFVQSDLLNSQEYKNLQAAKAAVQAAATAVQTAPSPAPAQPTIATGSAAPAGAMTVPTSTTKYPIKTTVKTYGSMSDAMNGTNPKGEVLAGATWYEYCEKQGMINITQTPGISIGTWINPADNVVPVPKPAAPTANPPANPSTPATPPPAPKLETATDIQHSFIPLMPDGSPVECEVLQNVMAIDALGNGAAITATKGQYVKVYGTHVAGTHIYATVKSSDKAKQGTQMYGILVTARDNFAPYLNDPYTLGERLQVNWELIYDKVAKSLEGIFRAIKKKK